MLRRSESELTQILEEDPSFIFEQNSLGQTVLHLSAIDWPVGLALLLKAGADAIINQPDEDGNPPLAYAVAYRCLGAVQLLTSAGSTLYYQLEDGPDLFVFDRILIENFDPQTEDELRALLVTALVGRRKTLRNIVLELAPEIAIDLAIPNDRLIDEQAEAVSARLASKSILIPEGIRVPGKRKTVYHSLISRDPLKVAAPLAAHAELLYGAGFRDIDGFDWDGLTPLMACDIGWRRPGPGTFGLACWLLSKGARIDCTALKHSPAGQAAPYATAAHYISHYISECLYMNHTSELLVESESLQNHSTIFMEPSHSPLRKAFIGEYEDDCLCGCSALGCRPIHMMLKALWSLDLGLLTP